MTMATTTTLTEKKWISILLENFAIIQMYSVYPSVLELAPAEYAKKAFNSKYKNQKLSVVVQVVCNTLNLVISRCCSAKNGYERQWTASLKTQHLIEKHFCMSTDHVCVLCLSEARTTLTSINRRRIIFQLPAHSRSQSPRFFVRTGHAWKSSRVENASCQLLSGGIKLWSYG